MKTTSLSWLLPGILIIGSACDRVETAPDATAYEDEILQWRTQRLANLKAPYGYLNLVGLYWLEDGNALIGSADDNDLVLPGEAASHLGELRISDTGVTFTADPGVDVRYEGVRVRSILQSDDTTDNPVALTHGSLAWTIINREGRFALRLRDLEHSKVANFAPLEYFPIDATYRLTARLRPFDEPKILNVGTTIEGLGYRPESPGSLVFDIHGVTHELEAYKSGDRLFFVFGDQTSGHETYPAGRFVYADWPGEDGTTVLDFNKAYNPPCAFNAFATCPVASPRNRLNTRLEVGEVYDPKTHSVPEGYY